MRIAQLSLTGRGAWPDLRIERLNPQLNVLFGQPGAGKSTVAQLIGHLLYGKTQTPWRNQVGKTLPLVEGQLVVESTCGHHVLRRHADSDRTCRLTVAALGDGTVDAHTVQSLLYDISPQVLAQFLAVDFAQAPAVDWLLRADFTRELRRVESGEATARRIKAAASSPVDRQRIDELIRQRDAINESIEKQLSSRRREGTVLAAELTEVEGALSDARRKLDGVHADLRVVAGEITECETKLRYASLERAVTKHIGEQNLDRHRGELAQLEAEVTRCRKTLDDLKARETAIRAELAQVASDGTADGVGFLADSRGALGVLEKLVSDLDVEVALLARGADSTQKLDGDSHARLSPVAAMLRQQVYTLCGLVTEQERYIRRQQLVTESRQISRAQLDLGERLEHLLAGRERLVHELDRGTQARLLRPHVPVAQHCRCEHHTEFLTHADSYLVGYPLKADRAEEWHSRHESLRSRERELQAQAENLALEIETLEAKWQDVQRERAGLVGYASLEEQRAERERLEAAIREALKPVATNGPDAAPSWRASDILAQLTDGELVQIRLDREGRKPAITDRTGRVRRVDSLSTAEHDQLYLSLTLALVGSFARRGIQLPLVLDEPFLRQNGVESAAMAGVLAEFARAGHQLLVFTEDREALRRFESLGSTVFDIAAVRRTRGPETQRETQLPETTLTRLVRETEDGQKTRVLELNNGKEPVDSQFYLTEESPVGEFPVLGSATTDAFAKIGITHVGHITAADADTVAARLNLEHITGDTVALWQAHMRLMTSVPGLTLDDAQILTACGIRSFADLQNAVPIELEMTVREFITSDRGQRFAGHAGRINASRIRQWSHLGRHSKAHQAPHNGDADRPERAKLRAHRPEGETLEYFLDRTSHVANAPSISPQTASRLATVGIRTVADLLDARPVEVAEQLGLGHITAQVVVDWQLQAQLMCQIPDLRAYGAQLLVACGFRSPQQIAATRSSELIRAVQAFCESDTGERILKDHEPPTAAKIKRWAQNAAICRPLEAA